MTLFELLEARLLWSSAPFPFVHTTATLSEGRSSIRAASTEGEAFFAGGHYGEYAPGSSSALDVFDAATDTWTSSRLPHGSPYVAGASSGKAYFPNNDLADIYDTATGQWSSTTNLGSSVGSVAIPVANEIAFPTGSGRGGGGDTLFYDVATDQVTQRYVGDPFAARGTSLVCSDYGGRSNIYVYDLLSGFGMRRSAMVGADLIGPAEDVTMGTHVLVVSRPYARVGHDTPCTAYLYDVITGRGNPVPQPLALAIDTLNTSATSAGSKALFPEAGLPDSRGYYHYGNVACYDLATGQWSTAAMEDRELTAAASADRVALFAGGDTSSLAHTSDTVDLFTDQAPSSVAAGGVEGRSAGKAAVVLQNTGDAELAAGYTVNVYAVPLGRYHGAVLLGSSAALTNPLAAGSSLRLSVPIQLPANSPPSTYHLVAMVRANDGTLTPFAGGTATFAIRAAVSASVGGAARAVAGPAVRSPFVTVPLAGSIPSSSRQGDPLGLHDRRTTWGA